MNERRDPRPARCFYLAAPPQAGRARLVEEDEQHAARALRLAAGDSLTGLDGQGRRWPLRVLEVRRGALELATEGEPELEPEPGSSSAALPWIEVAVAFPKGARADEMLDRLVQLGAAAVAPLLSARSQGYDAERVEHRVERWARIARSACKQAQRAWLPEIRPAEPVAELLRRRAGAGYFLHPGARARLPERLAAAPWGTRAAPLRLWIGPEGGWSPDEEREFERAGVEPVALAPSILRVETAAEAALAVAVAALWRR